MASISAIARKSSRFLANTTEDFSTREGESVNFYFADGFPEAFEKVNMSEANFTFSEMQVSAK